MRYSYHFYTGRFLSILLLLSACQAESDRDNALSNTKVAATSSIEVARSPYPSSNSITIGPTALPIPSPTPATFTEELPASIVNTPVLDTALPSIRFITELPLNPIINSSQVNHVWWSNDSQQLYFQDVVNHLAWVYDLQRNTIQSIPYEPRSVQESWDKLQESLPPEAFIYSVSPSHQLVLYTMPLEQPVLADESGDLESSPAYTDELWLRHGEVDHLLGLVDTCFDFYDPVWSQIENRAIVNAGSVPDLPRTCMYDVWLIDITSFTVGPLKINLPNSPDFEVTDLSPKGNILVIRADLNYIYNLETDEAMPVPGADTSRAILVGENATPAMIRFETEFTPSISALTGMNDHIFYFSEQTLTPVLVDSVEGIVVQRVVSPDRKHIVLITTNEFSGKVAETITPSLWLLTVP